MTKKLVSKELVRAKNRMAIARDVIERILANQFYADHAYVRFNEKKFDKIDNDKGEVNLRTFITSNKLDEKCGVCGIGSLFLSHVLKYNRVSCKMTECVSRDGWVKGFSTTFHETLLKNFDAHQLALIEWAFEAGSYQCDSPEFEELEEEDQEACQYFYDRYRTDQDRLFGIMVNIIQNKGTFNPYVAVPGKKENQV